MSLVSKWADDPKLVEQAKQQDLKVITSKKGQPLVSKWATAEPITEEKIETVKKKPHQLQETKAKVKHQDIDKNRKKIQEHTSEKSLSKPNELSSRLSGLTINPETHVVNHEDDWEDDDDNEGEEEAEGEVAEEVEEKPVAPTKAAQDFASRLGITLDVPKGPKSTHGDKVKPNKPAIKKNQDPSYQQIRSIRDEQRQAFKSNKLSKKVDWDQGKTGTRVDYTIKKDDNKTVTDTKAKKDAKPKVDLNSVDLSAYLLDPDTNWADLDDDDDDL